MKLQISFTKRVFFIVILVGMVSMLVFLALTQPTGKVVRTVGSKITNTIAITGVNTGESIGKEFGVLTESHLSGLGTTTEQTNEGRTQVKQYLRLHGGTSQTHSGDLNTMSGGTIVFERNEMGEVGDFLKFNANEDAFEYEIEFSSGFNSAYNNNGKLTDIREETLNLLGGQFAIIDAEVDTSSHWIELKMIGPGGTIVLKDLDYTDSLYTDHGAQINGKNIPSRVQIKGYDKGNNKFSITNIKYRPQVVAKTGKHVYVEAKHGLQQYLRYPQIMLTPEFEIIYGGLKGGPAPAVVADVTGAVSTELSEGIAELINKEGPTGNMITGAATASGNMIWFKPVGDDQYDLIASTNTANYKIGLASTRGGLHWGDDDQQFIFTESANSGVFNIALRDYFMISSGTDIGDYTSIMMYENVLPDQNKVQFRDIAGGGSKQAKYDSATGKGQVVLNGRSTTFYVDLNSPHDITVDLTQDGNINGARAEMVLRGGPRLRFSGAGTIKLIAPQRLFHEPSGDETTTFNIGSSGGDITLTVANQATLTLKSAGGGIKYGLTPFGFEFEWNKGKEPEELKIGMPGSGIAQPFRGGGTQQAGYGSQAGAYVVVTLERSKLAKKSS
ncbi:hypothetical protein GF358_01480 [Candidatus Woesearchaeota archaeon]|nr:hypothetical protein [Candidatus Woesearchaeota archaeon]